MKTSKAPLEQKRPLLLLVGLVFALSVTLVSFEWRTPYRIPLVTFGDPDTEDGIFELPPVIPYSFDRPQKVEEPPKLDPKSTEITLVDNDQQVADGELSLKDVEVFEPQLGTNNRTIEADSDDDPPAVLDWAPVLPEYCGGEKAMLQFLSEELKYPEIPRVNGISGTVRVQFVVGRDGKVRDAKVVRPVDPWLDAEALRVAKLLDCFTPGKQAGKDVDVYFVLPVKFALNR